MYRVILLCRQLTRSIHLKHCWCLLTTNAWSTHSKHTAPYIQCQAQFLFFTMYTTDSDPVNHTAHSLMFTVLIWLELLRSTPCSDLAASANPPEELTWPVQGCKFPHELMNIIQNSSSINIQFGPKFLVNYQRDDTQKLMLGVLTPQSHKSPS